jgi:hypothetical protein
MSGRDTINFTEEVVFKKLRDEGFFVQKKGRGQNFLINDKIINFKGCNYNNGWMENYNYFGGWDKIDPNNIDYFVGVSFNSNHEDVRFFIFTKKEIQEIPRTKLSGREKDLRNLNLIRNDEASDRIVSLSEDGWDKII